MKGFHAGEHTAFCLEFDIERWTLSVCFSSVSIASRLSRPPAREGFRSSFLTRRSLARRLVNEGRTLSYQLPTSGLRRPQPDEICSIFARLVLEGDFWDPQSDIFG